MESEDGDSGSISNSVDHAWADGRFSMVVEQNRNDGRISNAIEPNSRLAAPNPANPAVTDMPELNRPMEEWRIPGLDLFYVGCQDSGWHKGGLVLTDLGRPEHHQ